MSPTTDKKPSEYDAPPKHPDTLTTGDPAIQPQAERPPTAQSRRSAQENWNSARKFLSAYAKTWIGMSPLWLMGEAIIPGKQVGGTFKKGAKQLQSAALEVRDAVSTSAKDVVVIIDERVQSTKSGGSTELTKASEVIKAAGDNALLVVTTSLEKVQQQLEAHKDLSPALKKVVQANGRDVVVLIDKALRHPVVVTGVKQFAESKGIPHADALLRLASYGLTKILASLPPDVPTGNIEATIEEIDAVELEKQTSKAGKEKAEKIGKNGQGPSPKVELGDADPYAKMKKDNPCVVM